MQDAVVALVLITTVAAFLNGGIGYGFSSITLPVALIFYANRVLNPALVLIEIFVNFYSLFLNRASLRNVFPHLKTILVGLGPGIIIGSALLGYANPTLMKGITFAFLAPLILLQGAGFSYPLKCKGRNGYFFGGAIGALYSLTTVSGPPLAMLLVNEGFQTKDFKAALAIIRIVESTLTFVAYIYLGLYTTESIEVAKTIIPGVLIAMPLGSFLISKLNPLTFRRICISIDCWLISFGLYRSLVSSVVGSEMYLLMLATAIVIVDAFYSRQFFKNLRLQKGKLAAKNLTEHKIAS